MRILHGITLAVLGGLVTSAGALAQADIPDGDWRTINRDLAATRFSPLDDINADNVTQLTRAWSYRTQPGRNTSVPIVVDGVMYLPVGGNRVAALDADTGEEKWTYWVQRRTETGPAMVSTRGVGYWPGDDATPPRILFMAGTLMFALDAETGQPVADFGDDGAISVGEVGYGGTPSIFEDVAVIGAATLENPIGPPGNPRAFDVRTGEKLWEFQTVPQEGEPFNDTWQAGFENRSGANMWAFAAPFDAERGLVYLPISSPAANYYGGDRPGAGAFGNSIVAVDAHTGEYKWHFQTVHHDLWDSDMPSAGALFEVERDGEREPVIAHVGKTSFFYVLNRETGEPFHEVVETPTPAGDVPTEYYHPTQPIPVAPPPLSRVHFSVEDDMVTAEDTTAEHAAACQAALERHGGAIYNEGPFSPFLYKAADAPPRTSLQVPGGTGGVNWGGVAVDPTTGWVFANAQETNLIGWVEDKDPDVSYSFEDGGSRQPYDRASVDGVGPFHSFSEPLSGQYDDNGRPEGPTASCVKPPWAHLYAIDANTGEIKWASVLGLNENLPEDKQLIGASGSAGPTVTAGGLVFIGATTDRRFRAFDAATGEELWTAQLGANADANPMSYAGASGKQYVAVIAGNEVVAYALP